MTDSPFMTYQEAADYLRVSRDTIRRYVRNGQLEAVGRKGTQRRLVTRKSVEDLIR